MKNRKKLEKIEISEVDKKNDTEERKLNKREFVTEELLKVPKDKSTSYLSQGQKAYKVYKYAFNYFI